MTNLWLPSVLLKVSPICCLWQKLHPNEFLVLRDKSFCCYCQLICNILSSTAFFKLVNTSFWFKSSSSAHICTIFSSYWPSFFFFIFDIASKTFYRFFCFYSRYICHHSTYFQYITVYIFFFKKNVWKSWDLQDHRVLI